MFRLSLFFPFILRRLCVCFFFLFCFFVVVVVALFAHWHCKSTFRAGFYMHFVLSPIFSLSLPFGPTVSLTIRARDISFELKFCEQTYKTNWMTCIYTYNIRVFAHETKKPEKIKKVLECDVFFFSSCTLALALSLCLCVFWFCCRAHSALCGFESIRWIFVEKQTMRKAAFNKKSGCCFTFIRYLICHCCTRLFIAIFFSICCCYCHRRCCMLYAVWPVCRVCTVTISSVSRFIWTCESSCACWTMSICWYFQIYVKAMR